MIAFLGIMGLFTALPLIYTIMNSLKPINELFLFPPRLFVNNPTFENYINLINVGADMLVPFERYVFNSIFVTAIGTTLYIFIASFAAYPLAKHNFKGKTIILQIVVWAILFRPEVTAIPQYAMIANLRLVDTYFAIILPALSGSFGVFLIRQFILSVPDEVLESARIDGCGEISTFYNIVLPMIKPAILTLLIFTFLAMWNVTGVQYIFSENLKMLPTALQQLSSAGIARAGIASAVAVFLLTPPILIFILCQNSVLETMAHSGLKS
jgi:ABC-type glycerol-3-phosphate transport system permease component